MITQEEESKIKEKVNECPYRNNISTDKDPVYICSGWCTPCSKIIERGQCDVYIEYFEKHRLKNILEDDSIDIKIEE